MALVSNTIVGETALAGEISLPVDELCKLMMLSFTFAACHNN